MLTPLTEDEIIRLGGCVYDMYGSGLPIWATKLAAPLPPAGGSVAIFSTPATQPARTPSTAITEAVWESVGQWKRLTAAVDLLQSLGERLTDDDYMQVAQLTGIADNAAFAKIATNSDQGIAHVVRANLKDLGAIFPSILDNYARTFQNVLAWQRTGEQPRSLGWEGDVAFGGSIGGCVIGGAMMVAGAGILATTAVVIVASDGTAIPLAPMATTLGSGLFVGGTGVVASQCF